MLDFAAPLREDRFAGVAYVFGEAGIGKSRLSYEFRRSLRETMAVSWFTCQSDQILRKPFNPFIYFLKNYFEQSPENSAERNRELFEQNFLELQYELTENRHPEADAVRREISRTQSVLAAMVGIHYPDSLWEQLDARGRYQNALGGHGQPVRGRIAAATRRDRTGRCALVRRYEPRISGAVYPPGARLSAAVSGHQPL
ncbi:MAG: hypothetical protein V9F82_07655 [Dermatophilaceae bacterium]